MNNKSIIWRDFTRKCKDTRAGSACQSSSPQSLNSCSCPESGLSHKHRWLLVLKGDKRKNISSELEG